SAVRPRHRRERRSINRSKVAPPALPSHTSWPVVRQIALLATKSERKRSIENPPDHRTRHLSVGTITDQSVRVDEPAFRDRREHPSEPDGSRNPPGIGGYPIPAAPCGCERHVR